MTEQDRLLIHDIIRETLAGALRWSEGSLAPFDTEHNGTWIGLACDIGVRVYLRDDERNLVIIDVSDADPALGASVKVAMAPVVERANAAAVDARTKAVLRARQSLVVTDNA